MLKQFALRAAVLAALVVSTVSEAGSYFRVVSWNLRHEGWTDETNYTGDAQQIWNQFGSSSTSPNGCDAVFLQEVMYESAVQGIVAALKSISGVNWTYAVTAAVGRSSYKEMYAVVYRTDTVSLISSTLYADTYDYFEREPQIVKLRQIATGEDYTFINWHTVWGVDADRQAELAQIDTVFNSVQNGSSTDQDVIMVGDNNVAGTSTYWNDLKAISPAPSCKVDVQTTINSSGGWVSNYDHVWLQSTYVTEYSSSGRDYVASPLNMYNTLSDHAPIWLKLYSAGSTD